MNIVIIGSGNVAAVLGRKFKMAGHTIAQVYSRNASAASALAYEWDTESTNYKSLVTRTADIYIIAVNDDAIDDVVTDLRLPGKVVAHTAASVAKEVLKDVSAHYGVFYPLQSLRKEMITMPEIPIFIDGSDEIAKSKLGALAHSIADEMVMVSGDGDRMKLHVAAVMVSNFTNHLYALAEDYCRREGLHFKQLLPLIEETAQRIKTVSPKQSQTGPAIRHDDETIQKHIGLLAEYPQLKQVYELLTGSIQQLK
jgi:predicted short-subunit dehydrogenase-like oxidoreductase (DUF2520 family)